MGVLIKLFSGIVSTLLVTSCSQVISSEQRRIDPPQQILKEFELGTLLKTDGSPLTIDQISQSKIVIVFASDTCTTCAAEAAYWKEIFADGMPTNVYFFHLLIGGFKEDAQDWKDFHSVTWDVAIQPEDHLYRQYCPAIVTPCFLIVDRASNKITQTYEVLDKKRIEEITGPWSF